MRRVTIEYEPDFFPRNRGCIHVGDSVLWRGMWGKAEPIVATVTAMTLTDFARSKSGIPVPVVTPDYVAENRVLFDLSNGSWAYASQITARAEQ